MAASTTAAALAGVLLMYASADRAGAAPPGTTSAGLIQLNISDVGPLDLSQFDGTYGTAGSPPLNGDEDTGDFSDPDGVRAYYQDGTHAVVTSNTDAKHYAKVDAAGIEVRLHGADFISTTPSGAIGSLNTYAECTPPPFGPYSLGYAHTDGQQIAVLGHRVDIGTTDLTVSGADLNEPDTLGDSTLRVTFTQHVVPADEIQTPGAYEAEAWFDVSVAGVLRDPAGVVVYDGPIAGARLGEVHARCHQESPSPSPTDTESPSPSPSPTDTESPAPSPTDTESPTPSPSPTDSESPSPSPTDTGSPTPPPSPSPSDSESPTPPPSPTATDGTSGGTSGGTDGGTGGDTGGSDGGTSGGTDGGTNGGNTGGTTGGTNGGGGDSDGGAYGDGGTGGGRHGGGGELADTGDQIALVSGAAAILTAVGGVLFVRRRRS
ncbi:MSCRAMM family adhesin SdrC [Streptomyces sp. NBC_00144]|uniref:LPXTG cell wall anchor domain-containing protein n=1 Tax=Streptomyces sp. NBC_00144 TaxID=2975665 RepID=UPI00324EC9A8